MPCSNSVRRRIGDPCSILHSSQIPGKRGAGGERKGEGRLKKPTTQQPYWDTPVGQITKQADLISGFTGMPCLVQVMY